MEDLNMKYTYIIITITILLIALFVLNHEHKTICSSGATNEQTIELGIYCND